MATTCTDAEAGFWAAIEAAPAEATHLLVFADWLAEHGDPREQAFRVLGKWGMSPYVWRVCGSVGWWPTGSPHVVAEHFKLPRDWLSRIPRSRSHVKANALDAVYTPNKGNPHKFRVLLKATVAGFLSLPPERRAELLERGPVPQEG